MILMQYNPKPKASKSCELLLTAIIFGTVRQQAPWLGGERQKNTPSQSEYNFSDHLQHIVEHIANKCMEALTA